MFKKMFIAVFVLMFSMVNPLTAKAASLNPQAVKTVEKVSPENVPVNENFDRNFTGDIYKITVTATYPNGYKDYTNGFEPEDGSFGSIYVGHTAYIAEGGAVYRVTRETSDDGSRNEKITVATDGAKFVSDDMYFGAYAGGSFVNNSYFAEDDGELQSPKCGQYTLCNVDETLGVSKVDVTEQADAPMMMGAKAIDRYNNLYYFPAPWGDYNNYYDEQGNMKVQHLYYIEVPTGSFVDITDDTETDAWETNITVQSSGTTVQTATETQPPATPVQTVAEPTTTLTGEPIEFIKGVNVSATPARLLGAGELEETKAGALEQGEEAYEYYSNLIAMMMVNVGSTLTIEINPQEISSTPVDFEIYYTSVGSTSLHDTFAKYEVDWTSPPANWDIEPYMVTYQFTGIPFSMDLHIRIIDELNGTDIHKWIYLEIEDELSSTSAPETTNEQPAQTTMEIPSTAETPSAWAVEQVNQAITSGLVPQSLQSKYTQAITRAEFCALAVTAYERVKGEITERKVFDDTEDINVQKMAAIGIITGSNTEGTQFSPDNPLTREQAAVILARLANAIGRPFASGTAAFDDNGDISAYALESVGQIQAAGVMGSATANGNNFLPQGVYTREQSIITILKLF